VNFLTSDEVEAILGNYKVHFERIKSENRELKEKVELTLEKKVEIEKDYIKVYSENAALQKEAIYFQDLSRQLDEKLAIKEKESATEEKSRINTYKSLAELDNTDNCQEVIEKNISEPSQKELLLNLIKSYTACKSDMKQCLENYDNILKENDSLQTQANELVSTSLNPKICTRCKGTFNPIENNENSCVFHPGNLKYYSCRKCGADEYWSCCNQCRSCLKGCRKGKHISF